MSDGSDPCLYPGTDVLRNVPGLRSAPQLTAFETLNTARRSYELLRTPLPGVFDTDHLKAIHRYLFQDVFHWAGEFRTTMLGKAEQLGKLPTWFTPPHLLEHEAERIFAKLTRANRLRDLPRADFAQRAAGLLAEINHLHPFREGNGRTQRLFVDSLARQTGHALYFDVVSRERMVQASVESMAGKPDMMIRMFDEITDSERIQPLRRAIAFLDRQKFKWNDTYIATTTPGQNYSGRLVGRDGKAFMMRSDDDRILIGRVSDIDHGARTGDCISFRAAR